MRRFRTSPHPDWQDYRPPWEDVRDYHPGHPALAPMLGQAAIPAAEDVPPAADMGQWLTYLNDQGMIGSCTGQAGAYAVSTIIKRIYGKEFRPSPLFLYKMARFRCGYEGDTGLELRNMLGALATYGICPEVSWPYSEDPKGFDLMPPWPVGQEASNYQALTYLRLDTPGQTPAQVLARIKRWVAAKFPVFLGFTCYSSIDGDLVAATGAIPFPQSGEKVVGGHGICILQYDSRKTVFAEKSPLVGALGFPNSWGTAWGRKDRPGWGWLPEEYVLRGLASDAWTIVKQEWLDQGDFGFS